MKNKKRFLVPGLLLAAFAMWTAVVALVDVQPIGPQASSVGLATVNGLVHRALGVNWSLYVLTDWLGLVPVGVAAGFALLGLGQWVKRRSLCKVDFSILALGGFYLAVIGAYAFFEIAVVNCRPVLIGGVLEASYPSSTTVLSLCVMPAAAMQMRLRVKRPFLRKTLVIALNTFALLMVVARLLSGVHWLTDIVGGVLLSAGLVTLYKEMIQ